jgi:hypothetical protein
MPPIPVSEQAAVSFPVVVKKLCDFAGLKFAWFVFQDEEINECSNSMATKAPRLTYKIKSSFSFT